jgi:hypothetical protein
MAQEVQIGTILMSEWPQSLGFSGEPYSGNWSVVQALDASAIDHKIRLAGWNFFFIASEVKAMCFGALGTKKMQSAVNRILSKVSQQHFNGLEVTGIVAKRFLGLPWTVISAHSRHVQKGCYLDSVDVRRSSDHALVQP